MPNSLIDKVEPGKIYNSGTPENVDLVVWTGIQPVEVVRHLPIDINRSGRVIINQYHQVPTYLNVFIVGDCVDLPHAPSAQLVKFKVIKSAMYLRNSGIMNHYQIKCLN